MDHPDGEGGSYRVNAAGRGASGEIVIDLGGMPTDDLVGFLCALGDDDPELRAAVAGYAGYRATDKSDKRYTDGLPVRPGG